MNVSRVLILALGFVAADQVETDEVKKEVAKLQGTWKVVSIHRDGKELEEVYVAPLRLTIAGNTRVIKADDQVVSRATYTVDPSKKPKETEVTVSEGPLMGKKLPGIYELDGDTLKICLPLEGAERPKEFTSKPGSNHLLQVFRREKKPS